MIQRPSDPVKSDRIFIASAYAAVNIEMFGLGLSVFLSFHTLNAYLKLSAADRKSKRPFVFFIFVVLCLLSVSVIADSVYHGYLLASSGRNWVHVPWENRVIKSDKVVPVFKSLHTLVGEGLLLYRCCILYRHRLWLALLPGFPYVGSIAFYILSVAVEGFEKRFLQRNSIIGVVTLAVASNVLSTLLILGRLWYMRWTLRKLSLKSPCSRQYTAISAVLVESALPLSITGILVCALLGNFTVSETLQPVGYAPHALWSVLSALCPQFVVYRVLTGKTWVTHQDVSVEVMLSRPMAFSASYVLDGEGRTTRSDLEAELGNRTITDVSSVRGGSHTTSVSRRRSI